MSPTYLPGEGTGDLSTWLGRGEVNDLSIWLGVGGQVACDSSSISPPPPPPKKNDKTPMKTLPSVVGNDKRIDLAKVKYLKWCFRSYLMKCLLIFVTVNLFSFFQMPSTFLFIEAGIVVEVL